MSFDCKLCKNEGLCKEASLKGELVKCKPEIINDEEVNKFCEDLIEALVDWRSPGKAKKVVRLTKLFFDEMEQGGIE